MVYRKEEQPVSKSRTAIIKKESEEPMMTVNLSSTEHNKREIRRQFGVCSALKRKPVPKAHPEVKAENKQVPAQKPFSSV
jgi:hypothetical protein